MQCARWRKHLFPTFCISQKNGEIIITGYKGNSTELVIPSEIDGKPVTTIGNGKYDGYWGGMTGVENIKRLVMPDTIKKIMAYTFRECENLESVRFSSALSYIGGQAFVGCDNLTEVDINTTGDLTIAPVVDENGGTFAHCDMLKTVTIKCAGSLTLAGSGIFENCGSLAEVSLSTEQELNIGKSGFENCKELYDVKLEAKKGVWIGDNAFCGTSLNTILLPKEAPITLGNSVFANCRMLEKLTLLSNVESIGEGAFTLCGYYVGGLTIKGNRGSIVEKYVENHNKRYEGYEPELRIRFEAIEDTCDHSSGRHNTYIDSDSVTRYRLNPEDESSHPKGHQYGDIYTRYCADCGTPIQTGILFWYGFEAHEMVNGVCNKCGYTGEPKRTASIDDFDIDEDSTTIGSTVHVKSGMAYGGDYYLRKVQISVFTDSTGAHGYYSNVSKEFAYGEAKSYDLSKLDEIAINGPFTCEYHKTEEAFPTGDAMVMVFVSVYNEDGTAGENTFGAKVADTVVVSRCAHPTHTDVYNANIPIRYTANKDGKTHIWQSGYDRICDNCHENMDRVYGKENIADHDYTNGDVCPCGYDRSNCQHTPSKTKLYNRTLFRFLNEKEHESYAIVWDLLCSICGKAYCEEIDYVGDENNTLHEKSDHYWVDGKCVVEGCGYECLHPETKADGSENYQDKDLGTVSLTDNGDGVTHHRVYNVERTCLLYEHSWTVTIDDPAEKHTMHSDNLREKEQTLC